MKTKKILFSLIAVAVIGIVISVVHLRAARNKGQTSATLKSGGTEQTSMVTDPGKVESPTKEAEVSPDTGAMFIGRFPGNVVYDPEKDYYFLELRGARLPFKTSPKRALEVELEAYGKDELEKNKSLLYGIIGPQVSHATLLLNPDEEDELMPAVQDLSRYIKMVAPRKFAGVAYTKPGGKSERSVVKGSQIQSFEKDASPLTPLISIKGPKSGARSTKVKVLKGGKFVVEGETYTDVAKAADFVGMMLIKMLCGSSDCPDAAACATGGDCGCGG